MSILVRPLRADEGRIFLDIHERAIRGLAASHYPPEVIAAWVVPATDQTVARFIQNPERETRVIAELDGEPVGLGVLVVDQCYLRACYVIPEAARKGVGSALVKEMERIARASGLARLDLVASLNAEPFYTSVGYQVVLRGDHVLRSGVRMAAVNMTKHLA
jgi:putative acetyltransferase